MRNHLTRDTAREDAEETSSDPQRESTAKSATIFECKIRLRILNWRTVAEDGLPERVHCCSIPSRVVQAPGENNSLKICCPKCHDL